MEVCRMYGDKKSRTRRLSSGGLADIIHTLQFRFDQLLFRYGH